MLKMNFEISFRMKYLLRKNDPDPECNRWTTKIQHYEYIEHEQLVDLCGIHNSACNKIACENGEQNFTEADLLCGNLHLLC